MPFFQFLFVYPIFEIIFAPALGHGTLAQLVEQRTENPCVPGSIPGGTTRKNRKRLLIKILRFSCFYGVLQRVLLKWFSPFKLSQSSSLKDKLSNRLLDSPTYVT